MNLPKLVAEDVPLFMSLLSDFFPSADSGTIACKLNELGQEQGQKGRHSQGRKERERDGIEREQRLALKEVLVSVVATEGLIMKSSWAEKVLQLNDAVKGRHGVIIVGTAGSGKSSLIHCLSNALSLTTTVKHRILFINPKAVSYEEMFGETDQTTGDWVHGVFSCIWSNINSLDNGEVTWLVCDGPLDSVWGEHLNTILDDNNILTLPGNNRFPRTENVRLIFEVDGLTHAPPSTVSRTGVVFLSESDLGWTPILQAWLRLQDAHIAAAIAYSFDGYVGTYEDTNSYGHLFKYIDTNCSSVSHCGRIGQIQACCHLLGQLISITLTAIHNLIELAFHEQLRKRFPVPPPFLPFYHFVSSISIFLSLSFQPHNFIIIPFIIDALLTSADLHLSTCEDILYGQIERIFIFSLTWSVGALLDSNDRWLI